MVARADADQPASWTSASWRAQSSVIRAQLGPLAVITEFRVPIFAHQDSVITNSWRRIA